MGSFVYDKLFYSASFLWVFCCHSLGYLGCEIDGALKQYFRPFSLLIYLQGLSKTSNECFASQENGYQKTFYTFKHSPSIKIQLIKNLDISIATKSLPLIQNQKENQQSTIKKTATKQVIKRKKPQSTKIRKQHKQQSNLFMHKRKQNLPIPKKL